jgi:hypothetical protein
MYGILGAGDEEGKAMCQLHNGIQEELDTTCKQNAS